MKTITFMWFAFLLCGGAGLFFLLKGQDAGFIPGAGFAAAAGYIMEYHQPGFRQTGRRKERPLP